MWNSLFLKNSLGIYGTNCLFNIFGLVVSYFWNNYENIFFSITILALTKNSLVFKPYTIEFCNDGVLDTFKLYIKFVVTYKYWYIITMFTTNHYPNYTLTNDHEHLKESNNVTFKNEIFDL